MNNEYFRISIVLNDNGEQCPAITREIDGKTVNIQLTPTEVYEICRDRDLRDLRQNIASELENCDSFSVRLKNGKFADISSEFLNYDKFFDIAADYYENRESSYTEEIYSALRLALESELNDHKDHDRFILELAGRYFGDTDYIFTDVPNDSVTWTYYNPDASAGGAIITVSFEGSYLLAEMGGCSCADEFKEYVIEHTSETWEDYDGSPEFFKRLSDLAESSPDYDSFDKFYLDYFNKRYAYQQGLSDEDDRSSSAAQSYGRR